MAGNGPSSGGGCIHTVVVRTGEYATISFVGASVWYDPDTRSSVRLSRESSQRSVQCSVSAGSDRHIRRPTAASERTRYHERTAGRKRGVGSSRQYRQLWTERRAPLAELPHGRHACGCCNLSGRQKWRNRAYMSWWLEEQSSVMTPSTQTHHVDTHSFPVEYTPV